jgi:AcrR family transcriptional regulator
MSQSAKARPSRKLLGAEGSATRAALMDAAEQLMQEEGYGAVTSRRIAEKAGLKHQLIYYYFNTLDDLFLAVLRRGAEQNLERLAEVLKSETPLRALWAFVKEPRGTLLTEEFTAMAGHNAAIRGEIARFAEQYRRLQTEAIGRHLAERGVEPTIPPVLVSMLMFSMSSLLARETALGVSLGHAEAEAYFDLCLREFEQLGSAPSSPFAATEGRDRDV